MAGIPVEPSRCAAGLRWYDAVSGRGEGVTGVDGPR